MYWFPLKTPAKLLADLEEGRPRVGKDQRAHCGSEYDDQLRRLNQHHELPVFHEVAAGDGSQDDNDSDY